MTEKTQQPQNPNCVLSILLFFNGGDQSMLIFLYYLKRISW